VSLAVPDRNPTSVFWMRAKKPRYAQCQAPARWRTRIGGVCGKCSPSACWPKVLAHRPAIWMGKTWPQSQSGFLRITGCRLQVIVQREKALPTEVMEASDGQEVARSFGECPSALLPGKSSQRAGYVPQENGDSVN